MLIKTRVVITCMLAGITFFCHGQAITVEKGINLPFDSIGKNQFLTSLNGLLYQKEKANKDNTFVLKITLPETSVLLDEMKEIENNVKLHNSYFYQGYLTNVVKLDESNFVLQLSYIGVLENLPFLRASFKLLAKKQGERFYFYSPLKQNTSYWKFKKLNNTTYYYKDNLNIADADEYQKIVSFYDKKLNVPAQPINFYYCDNFTEVQQLAGVEYKEDYNGSKYNSLTAHENNSFLVINGWNDVTHRFDPHDLWHDRLRAVVALDVINRPVDEGCAYLYGGSWGISWAEVLAKFKKYAAENPNADWLKLYTESTDFEKGPRPLKVPYALNALIVQKLEREKGFAPVLELIKCGKREQGDENYFKALEKVTSINKADFNKAIWKLIKGLQ